MNKNKIQHAISCALVLGAILVIKFLLSVVTENGFIAFIVIFLTVLVPYLVYVFQKKYRDAELGGTISYSNALSYGIFLYFAAAVVLVIVQYIYYQYINPNFLSESFRLSIEQLQLLGMPASFIDEAIKIGVPSPAASAFQSIVLHALWGLLIALVTSAFVKKSSTNE
jgi:hypothetical protein